MPITVPLKALLHSADLAGLWPERFRELVAAAEAAERAAVESEDDKEQEPDRTVYAGLADWLREEGEPDLAAACEWLRKRPAVRVAVSNYETERMRCWHVPSPPAALGYSGVWGEAGCGLGSMLAALADRLAEARKALE